jgi:TPR repeat protein
LVDSIEGIDVRADPVKGAALVRQVADQGDQSAEFYVRHLERGIGVAKDMSTTAVYLKPAMDHGHPSAPPANE